MPIPHCAKLLRASKRRKTAIHKLFAPYDLPNHPLDSRKTLFVYISGYSAVIAYSRMMEREGWTRAAARIYRLPLS